ncbi:ROK family protein [Streptomyces sp. APSN-46.1]|uniref:ROK family protein n=1 Tax=Streptomyces sp. APSN-46.1 TaxID=2929049 RepID=UPI001FB24AA6|nr:ROK family protein [Streptomyces sp. APSN-46.1]MCJ1678332.1 ROK family protein [Streptomyces sp. APSN-46.1]
MTRHLGMDVGGTKVALRVESGEGDAATPYETSFRWAVGADVREDMTALAACLDRVRQSSAAPITAAGIAMPATLDPSGTVLTWPNRPGWTGLDLRAELRRMLPGTVISCADDGDLAALAEARAIGCDDIVYLGVGTGIGGGVVLGGRLCPGPARGSCELGHLVVDRTGAVCDCGRRGCVQAAASGPAILRRAEGLRGSAVEFTELQEAWAAGIPWGVAAIDEGCAVLAAAVVGAGELFHQEVTVIGGGFAGGLPGFVDLVEQHARRLTRAGVPQPRIASARLGGLSSLDGAVLLARDASERAGRPTALQESKWL